MIKYNDSSNVNVASSCDNEGRDPFRSCNILPSFSPSPRIVRTICGSVKIRGQDSVESRANLNPS